MLSIKCNKTYIPLIEPEQDLFNYCFYYLATSHNFIVLSNKRMCHMIFFDSLFVTKSKENKKWRWSIIFVSYCSSKSENLVKF